jgi:hypothetical protein
MEEEKGGFTTGVEGFYSRRRGQLGGVGRRPIEWPAASGLGGTGGHDGWCHFAE